MKLKSLKLGNVEIKPKTLIALIGALLIFGIGIGATVASPNDSRFALIACSIISLAIVVYTFSRNRKDA